MFITPTLRNVATRHAFFHNGVFTTLKDAVAFYAKRDRKLDDLPPQYRRSVGDAAALSASEIDDIVAFLQTLTDGYS